MIQRYDRDNGEGYYNILQLAWLFIMAEALEILIFFKAYDQTINEIKYRRIFWLGAVFVMVTGFTLLISTTCISLLTLMTMGMMR